MKIVFIVPSIKNAGGVARVTSIKANYFVEKWNYEVIIISQDNPDDERFFTFNKEITTYYLEKNSGSVTYLFNYYKQLSSILKKINPTHCIVADNGFKGFMLPLFITANAKLIFEVHGSRFENINQKVNLLTKIKNSFRIFGLKKYDKVTFFTQASAKEWNYSNAKIIPNFLPFETQETAKLEHKTVVCIARHSHEKGLDRLMTIWQKVVPNHQNWKLEIYGETNNYTDSLYKLSKQLNIEDSVVFLNSNRKIEEVYLKSSLLVMTSRFEGFGMVLIEAMSFGLPVIAFNCPIGPKSIIENNVNGFLVNSEEDFIIKMNQIMSKSIDLNPIIQNGLLVKQKYNIDSVMDLWKELLGN